MRKTDTFPNLLIEQIKDDFGKKNFKRIQDYFAEQAIDRAGFKFFEISFASAVSHMRYPHDLGYQPKDIIMTYNSDNVTVTFYYKLFDSRFLDISVSGPTTIRMLVGRYE